MTIQSVGEADPTLTIEFRNDAKDQFEVDISKASVLNGLFETIDAAVDRQQAEGDTLFEKGDPAYIALNNLRAEVRDLIRGEQRENDFFDEDGEKYLYALNNELLQLKNNGISGDGSLQRLENVAESFMAAYGRATAPVEVVPEAVPTPADPAPIDPMPTLPEEPEADFPETGSLADQAGYFLDRSLGSQSVEAKSEFLSAGIDLLIAELEGRSGGDAVEVPDVAPVTPSPDGFRGAEERLDDALEAFTAVTDDALAKIEDVLEGDAARNFPIPGLTDLVREMRASYDDDALFLFIEEMSPSDLIEEVQSHAQNALEKSAGDLTPQAAADLIEAAIVKIEEGLPELLDRIEGPTDGDISVRRDIDALDGALTFFEQAIEGTLAEISEYAGRGTPEMFVLPKVFDLVEDLRAAAGVEGEPPSQMTMREIVDEVKDILGREMGDEAGGLTIERAAELIGAAAAEIDGLLRPEFRVGEGPETPPEVSPDPVPDLWDFDAGALIPLLRAMDEANRLVFDLSEDGRIEIGEIDPLAKLTAATGAISEALLDNLEDGGEVSAGELQKILVQINGAQQALADTAAAMRGDGTSVQVDADPSKIAAIMDRINHAVQEIELQLGDPGDE
ncbi:hypothetical protein [Jannaschia sp. LMIT008]|uniref:hypothetical protein n=1 Tax=Jannaschia maritima TaxID=3032585 RepID=UPI0028122D3E|nr:hypothetical protein [Jannaschia sp. LMIT008]